LWVIAGLQLVEVKKDLGWVLTRICSSSIPQKSESGVIVGEEYEGPLQCSDKLVMLEAHVRIAPDTGRENQ